MRDDDNGFCNRHDNGVVHDMLHFKTGTVICRLESLIRVIGVGGLETSSSRTYGVKNVGFYSESLSKSLSVPLVRERIYHNKRPFYRFR